MAFSQVFLRDAPSWKSIHLLMTKLFKVNLNLMLHLYNAGDIVLHIVAKWTQFSARLEDVSV